MTLPTDIQKELDVYIGLFELGKELGKRYEKYDGDADWVEFVKDFLSRTPGAYNPLHRYQLQGRIEETKHYFGQTNWQWEDSPKRMFVTRAEIFDRLAELNKEMEVSE